MSIKSAAPEKGMEARKTKPNRWLRFYRCIPLYLMFLPGALYLLMDKYIPMAGLVIAFKKINWRKGIWGSEWVGFSNFTVCPTPFVTYILCIVVDFAISLARGSPTSPLSSRIHIIYRVLESLWQS